MPELTQRMIDAGAVMFDSNGIPMRADGTPALEENRVDSRGGSLDNPEPAGDGGDLLARIAAMSGLTGAEVPGVEPVTDENTLGFAFGPYYTASQQKYPENRTPLDPEWQWGQEGHKWEDFYTPNDRSTGGGFFLAKDALGGEVPFAFQEGASSPSTNNWRLIGNDPRFIMRNGRIVDRRATDLRGPPVPDIGFGNNYGGPLWNLGVGAAMGYPAGRSAGYTQAFGWPGTSNWASGTYWTG